MSISVRSKETAEACDRVLRRWTHYLEGIDRVRLHLDGARRVLDGGCGTGIVGATLSQDGAAVTGIDIDAEMLAVARRKQVVHGAGSFRVHAGDVLDIPYGAATFDGVVLSHLLAYAGEPSRVMKQVRRILLPRGVVVVTGIGSCAAADAMIAQMSDEFRERRIFEGLAADVAHVRNALAGYGGASAAFLSLDEVTRLLAASGFGTVIAAQDGDRDGLGWYVAAR